MRASEAACSPAESLVFRSTGGLFPSFCREELGHATSSAERKRIVTDSIRWMTEPRVYKWLFANRNGTQLAHYPFLAMTFVNRGKSKQLMECQSDLWPSSDSGTENWDL
jgi:hypothetical protein